MCVNYLLTTNRNIHKKKTQNLHINNYLTKVTPLRVPHSLDGTSPPPLPYQICTENPAPLMWMLCTNDLLISGNTSQNIRTGSDRSPSTNTLEMESSSTPALLLLMKLITQQPSSHSNIEMKELRIFLASPGTKKSLN